MRFTYADNLKSIILSWYFHWLFYNRGLFEKDKLVFSFLLCAEIMKLAGTILSEEWVVFTRGVGGMDKVRISTIVIRFQNFSL